jgi:hypothetical protein
MKNIILLTILLFVSSKAFSVEAIKLTATKSDDLFQKVYQTRYCKDISCSRTYRASYLEKISTTTVDMVFEQTFRAIIKSLKFRRLEILDTDFISSPSEYELIDLMTLDFSSADGDTPLSSTQIKRVLKLANSSNVQTGIFGVVTEEGVKEYLLIYSPKKNRVFTLKRAQFNKKKASN